MVTVKCYTGYFAWEFQITSVIAIPLMSTIVLMLQAICGTLQSNDTSVEHHCSPWDRMSVKKRRGMHLAYVLQVQ